MKYFLDTEFIEGFHKPLFGKRRHFIDLISIGIVSETGRKFAAISKEYRYKDANDWVRKNVLEKLYIKVVHGDQRNLLNVEDFHLVYGQSLKNIAAGVRRFIDNSSENRPEFYGYFADYDWVLFCSLFGRMIDLPDGYPMFCMDLKQMMQERGLTKEWKSKVCPDGDDVHDAIADAEWNKKLYAAIMLEPVPNF